MNANHKAGMTTAVVGLTAAWLLAACVGQLQFDPQAGGLTRPPTGGVGGSTGSNPPGTGGAPASPLSAGAPPVPAELPPVVPPVPPVGGRVLLLVACGSN